MIDASVYPGSSGSPIFASNSNGGTYLSRKRNGVVVGQRLKFLGVLAAVHTTQVDGTVRDLPASQFVSMQTPIGLGIAYKASAVRECMDLAMAQLPELIRGVRLSNPHQTTNAA